MPRVPLDLTPYALRFRAGTYRDSSDDIQTLLKEITVGRQERNQIARECAEQWDRADQLSTQLTLSAPLIRAALELDSADALNDDPEMTGIDTARNLHIAREVFSAAVQNYLAGLTTNAVEQ